MIIDAHMHLSGHGWVRGSYLRWVWNEFIDKYNKIHGANITSDELADIMRGYIDPEADKLVEILDKAGVDKGVIFSVDWALMTGEPRVTIREQNRLHAEAARKHPGRFISLCALDPRRGNSMELAKEAIEEWGMRGFYLMPAAGFRPDDPMCYYLYEKCIDWKVPVNIHCGMETRHLDYNHPMYIANVALEYPELNVILGHAGLEIWKDEAKHIATKHNVYLDFSGYQTFWWRRPEKFYEWLRDTIDLAGANKIMWASGFPNTDVLVSEKDWVKVIKEPNTDISFTEDEKQWILGKTAEQVYPA